MYRSTHHVCLEGRLERGRLHIRGVVAWMVLTKNRLLQVEVAGESAPDATKDKKEAEARARAKKKKAEEKRRDAELASRVNNRSIDPYADTESESDN